MATLNDFASKIPILRRQFRSMTATSNFNYLKEDRWAPFSSSADINKKSYKLNPLLRVAATSNSNLRHELTFNYTWDESLHFQKIQDSNLSFPIYGDQSVLIPHYVRDEGNRTKENNVSMGADYSLAFDVETQKGIQFWRYYVKLKNNLDFRTTCGVNFTYLEIQTRDEEARRDREIFSWHVKPQVTYSFSHNIDALFYYQYRFEKLFHTARNEATHHNELHSEFTMRF